MAPDLDMEEAERWQSDEGFSAEFKARVALEALVGDKTMAELSAKHDVHPNMISQWKRQARECLPEVS